MKHSKKESSVILQKDSAPEQVKTYFAKILELRQSGKDFPVNLNDVWPLAYGRKQEAVRVLKSDFVKNEDYIVQQSENQRLRKNAQSVGGDFKSLDYFLSVDCLEYFIAKKVKPVFEVYRKVFHSSVENEQQKISDKGTYREGELFPVAVGHTLVVGIMKQGEMFYQAKRILNVLGVRYASPGDYMKLLPESNKMLHTIKPGAKQPHWFINKEGFDKMLVLIGREIDAELVTMVYRDLFRIMPDGRDGNKKYPYQFTHEQINNLFYEVSKIKRVNLQNSINEIIRGGKR